jgi:hypothetical protein
VHREHGAAAVPAGPASRSRRWPAALDAVKVWRILDHQPVPVGGASGSVDRLGTVSLSTGGVWDQP